MSYSVVFSHNNEIKFKCAEVSAIEDAETIVSALETVRKESENNFGFFDISDSDWEDLDPDLPYIPAHEIIIENNGNFNAASISMFAA